MVKNSKSEEEIVSQEMKERLRSHLLSKERLFGHDSPFSELLQDMVNELLEGEMEAFHADQKTNGKRNKRNGRTHKQVLSETGPIWVSTPRDRNGEFEPELIGKRQRELSSGLDEQIIALYAQGNSIEDVRRLLTQLYGVEMSAGKISQITDKILPLIQEWRERQLSSFYSVVYLDAIHFKVRYEGRYETRAFYTVYAVDWEGKRDLLGLYVQGSEGARSWGLVLEDLKRRGVEDILVMCTDNPSGFSEMISEVYPGTIIQKCIVHQLRNSLKYVDEKDRKEVASALRKIYTAAQASKIKNGHGKVFPNLGFETKTKTMSKSKISIFAQMLGLINRSKFSKVVKKHNTDKFSKGIDTWTHFVSMMFMQLADVSSLRDISHGIRSASGNLNHLGVTKAPSKSSLSYRNKQRTYKVFEDLYFELLESLEPSLQRRRQYASRLKRKVFIMDGSIIPLCLSLFNWAKFRTKKGAIKMHAVLDYDLGLPNYAYITDGKTHDINPARNHTFPPESVIVVDRAYVDFEWLNNLDSNRVTFVTWLKKNVNFEIEEELPVNEKHEHILSDQIIRLTGDETKNMYPGKIRVIEVYDPVNDQTLVLMTNNLTWTADTISQLYKARWDVHGWKSIQRELLDRYPDRVG